MNCYNKYNELLKYLLQYRNTNVTPSQERVMSNCGYPNFKEEIEQIRKIPIGQSKEYREECNKNYNDLAEYYLQNQTEDVTPSHEIVMSNCGYPNFKEEIKNIRNIMGRKMVRRSKEAPPLKGGKKSRKRSSIKRKRRTQTR
jgi:peptide methionine sulfoxide reductase MsrB